MSHLETTFLGNAIVIHAPETARDSLEYKIRIAPTRRIDQGLFAFEAMFWLSSHSDMKLAQIGDLSANEPDKDRVLVELHELCLSVLKLADLPDGLVEEINSLFKRGYREPDDARSMMEIGPVFDGISQDAITAAAALNTIEKYGAQILDAPPWIYQGLSIQFTHERRKARGEAQHKRDIEETKAVNASLSGG